MCKHNEFRDLLYLDIYQATRIGMEPVRIGTSFGNQMKAGALPVVPTNIKETSINNNYGLYLGYWQY